MLARDSPAFTTLVVLILAKGRGFELGEDRQGANAVAVLSHGYWTRHFGANPAVLGRSLTLDGVPHTIIGVAPEGLRLVQDAELWVPLATDQEQGRRADFLRVIGRLAPGATLERAQAELTSVMQRLERQYLRQGMAPALVGIVLGLVAAELGPRVLASLLYGVSATDPLSFVTVPLFLAAVALFAAWLPARRATRVAPTEALRQEGFTR